ncbi:hypothetical protein [Desulfolithobacter dissulfuricans]|nr:hypothetical protein [Desulfolithobacter dissulfuricans]
MDWLLIIVGLLLVLKALFAIDVTGARYVVAGAGIVICLTGIWFIRQRSA